VAVVLAVAVAAGCVHRSDSKEPLGERPRSGQVVVEPGEIPSARYAVGATLYGFRPDGDPIALDAPVRAPLQGTLSPVAVPDRAGRRVAYNSLRGRRPVLRVYDAAGRDRPLAEGAYSFAWRNDGAVAYVKALRLELTSFNRYRGQVVVRRSLAARPVRWTAAPGRYVVAAWAGPRLLLYRLSARGFPDLLVVDGPGQMRRLAAASALVAVGPEGDRAAVARYAESPPVVRLLDLSTRREVASVRLADMRWVVEAGSWVGNRIAAATSAGIAILRVEPQRVELEQVLRLDRSTFELGPFEPQLDASGRSIVAWAERTPRPREPLSPAVVLACDRFKFRCRRTPDAHGIRLVYNPSRG
jgi:hypothetical protein